MRDYPLHDPCGRGDLSPFRSSSSPRLHFLRRGQSSHLLPGSPAGCGLLVNPRGRSDSSCAAGGRTILATSLSRLLKLLSVVGFTPQQTIFPRIPDAPLPSISSMDSAHAFCCRGRTFFSPRRCFLAAAEFTESLAARGQEEEEFQPQQRKLLLACPCFSPSVMGFSGGFGHLLVKLRPVSTLAPIRKLDVCFGSDSGGIFLEAACYSLSSQMEMRLAVLFSALALS